MRILSVYGLARGVTYGDGEGADRGSESGSNGDDGGKSELHFEVLGETISWGQKQKRLTRHTGGAFEVEVEVEVEVSCLRFEDCVG